MPSPNALDRLQGLRELKAYGYDEVVFRGATVRILPINKGMEARRLEAGEVDFTARDKSRVEVLRKDLDHAPKPGESFKDGSLYHRIKTVRGTDNTWICECEPAQDI